MKKRYSTQNIGDLAGRSIFFDANVLIYLFWGTGYQNWEKQYASLYSKLLKSNCTLYIDYIVISELINRTVRIEQEKLNKKSMNFKQFRNSIDGKETLNDIYNTVTNTLFKNFEVVGKKFSKQDILSFLHVEPLDFSDKAIISICKENNFILLTNDTDYLDADIEILTAHHKLLTTA